VITLQEPPKADLLQFLPEQSQTFPPRIARVEVILDSELHEIHVDLVREKVVERKSLHGRHSYIDPSYMKQVEAACLADEDVQREIQALQPPHGSTVVVEPWAYAPDGLHDPEKRISMVRLS
jgi:primary-amine oxidase